MRDTSNEKFATPPNCSLSPVAVFAPASSCSDAVLFSVMTQTSSPADPAAQSGVALATGANAIRSPVDAAAIRVARRGINTLGTARAAEFVIPTLPRGEKRPIQILPLSLRRI